MSDHSVSTIRMLAVIFPGQGSQFGGMAKDLLEQSESARNMMAQADSILGFELSKIMADATGDELGRTIFTQPAVFVHSMMLWDLFRSSSNMTPQVAAGHSLGEYSALCSAGVISFEDALRCIKVRSQAMDNAQPAGLCGMMAVVGVTSQRVGEVLDGLHENQSVKIANFNAPDQVVLSGTIEALKAVATSMSHEKRCRCVMLPVSSAFHTDLMSSAKNELFQFLNDVEFHSPVFPVISNVTASVFPKEPSEVKKLLAEQVVSPVLWTDTISGMQDLGVERFLEIGPGKVLTGLMKRIDRTLDCRTISGLPDIETFVGAYS